MWKDYLVPIVTTLVGAFVIWFQERLHARDGDVRRREALAEAGELVKFVDDWVTTHATVSAADDLARVKLTARDQLDRIYAKWLASQQLPPRLAHHALKRAFLLYEPHGAWGWVAHVAFYLFGVFIAFLTLGVVIDWKTRELPSIIAMYAVMLAVFLLLRAWAVSTQPSEQTPTPASGVSRASSGAA